MRAGSAGLHRPCCALVLVQGGEKPLEGVAVPGLVGCPRELTVKLLEPSVCLPIGESEQFHLLESAP